jgi:hypothetical protein
MAERIATEALVRFARTLEGQELTTNIRGLPFTARVVGGRLEFTPASTGKTRPESLASLDHVLRQFADTESTRPGDYLQLTVNASYVLTLIAMYLRSPEARMRNPDVRR